MGFFLFIKKEEEEEEELGSDIHIVWKKKSHELVWWIAFMGQNQAFFVSLSLSLTVCFLKFENWEDWAWMCIYMNESTVLLFLLLQYYYCFAAAMLCWLVEPICMRKDNALTLIDFPLFYFTTQAAWFLGFWVHFYISYQSVDLGV